MPPFAATFACTWVTHNYIAPAFRHMVSHRRPPRKALTSPVPSRDGDDPQTAHATPRAQEGHSTASVDYQLVVDRRHTLADVLASGTR